MCLFYYYYFLSEHSEVVTTVQKVSNIVSHKDQITQSTLCNNQIKLSALDFSLFLHSL